MIVVRPGLFRETTITWLRRECTLPVIISGLARGRRMSLAIGLPLHNQAGLTALLQQLNDPASPNYRQWLTPEQFTERFGPTEEDYQTVVAFAKASGLKQRFRKGIRI